MTILQIIESYGLEINTDNDFCLNSLRTSEYELQKITRFAYNWNALKLDMSNMYKCICIIIYIETKIFNAVLPYCIKYSSDS